MTNRIRGRADKRLSFRNNGTFTIVQFTDLHMHHEEPLNEETVQLMSRILDAEKPDLVVYTGDMVGGPRCPDRAPLLRQALEPVLSRQIPWAAIFGNHDAEQDTTKEALLAVQLESSWCLTEPGPAEINGLGNYVLRIHDAKEERLAAALYLFDTGDKAPSDIGGEAWVQSDQIQWYTQQSKLLEAERGARVPALSFIHIPLPEYEQAWDAPGRIGHKGEKVCCPDVNSGFLAAMVERGDVQAVFCGHDHSNDYCGKVHGIYLCYGHVTGCETRNPPEGMHGARVIRLNQGGKSFNTWVRLADGSVSEHRL